MCHAAIEWLQDMDSDEHLSVLHSHHSVLQKLCDLSQEMNWLVNQRGKTQNTTLKLQMSCRTIFVKAIYIYTHNLMAIIFSPNMSEQSMKLNT